MNEETKKILDEEYDELNTKVEEMNEELVELKKSLADVKKARDYYSGTSAPKKQRKKTKKKELEANEETPNQEGEEHQ